MFYWRLLSSTATRMWANSTGHIDAQVTNDEHFAGFDDAPRSKHEVMKDVIAKSKLAKYERQKAKDADEELRMELDEELGDIRSLLFQRPEQPTETPAAEPVSYTHLTLPTICSV